MQENNASATITYSDIQGGWSGTGNKDEDPLLKNPGSWEFYLLQDPVQPGVMNPCVDAGSDDVEMLRMTGHWTRSDGAHDTGIVDMGYHYNSPHAPGGKTIRVPADYATIQNAIDAASFVDTVLVSPGTYMENLDFKGKSFTLTSSEGPGTTCIDGNQASRVVKFANNETYYSVLEGFTIQNGDKTLGGGLYVLKGSPRIKGNIIRNNKATNGGGIYSEGSTEFPIIQDNIIADNRANVGGGIFCNRSQAVITNNLIIRNRAQVHDGGGLFCYLASPSLSFVTLFRNFAERNGGGLFSQHSSSKLKIINSIIWDNEALSGSQVGYENGPSPTITYTDIQHGWSGTGNKKEDPLFASGRFGHFYLRQVAAGQGGDSPCVDAGSQTAFEARMDTYWTRNDEVPDGGNKVDMGFHYGSFSHWYGTTLQVDFEQVSQAAGGKFFFTLTAGGLHAGRQYILLGTRSGTSPGTLLPGGLVTIPLNRDAFTNLILKHPNSSYFRNFQGQLNSKGFSWAQLNMTLSMMASLPVGTILDFAYSTMGPFDFVSDTVAIEVIP